VEPFWEAANSLTPGETSGPVQTEYGFHVLRLDDRRPVPFEEASRSVLLQRVVPAEAATQAMSAWSAGEGEIEIRTEAVSAIRDLLARGGPVSDSLLIATGPQSTRYLAGDLVAGWANLGPDERLAVERADAEGFLGWITADARRSLWSDFAESRGVDVPRASLRAAVIAWLRRVAWWSQAFAFRPGTPSEDVPEAARQALLSGAADARAARAEFRSLSPRIRSVYPITVP
jgi:hypothetical protein